MPCSIPSSQKSLKPKWLHIDLKYRWFKQNTQFNVINKLLLKKEEYALAWENPQPDVLVGEAEEGLQGRAVPGPGAFLVLWTLLLLLLSSFLVDSDLVTGVHPSPFPQPICVLESFIQTEGKNSCVLLWQILKDHYPKVCLFILFYFYY